MILCHVSSLRKLLLLDLKRSYMNYPNIKIPIILKKSEINSKLSITKIKSVEIHNKIRLANLKPSIP